MPVKPTDPEEEYFKREELQKLKKQSEAAARATAEAERKRLKELHWMRCPKCGMELSEVDFREVAVDTCFACGGLFLDKGEIEKILEGSQDGGAGWLKRMSKSLFG